MAIDWQNVGGEEGRFSLQDNGEISWQANKTNPLPGNVVARIAKGKTQLSPTVKIADAQGQEALPKIEAWLGAHIAEVLAPLFALMETEGENVLTDPAKSIGEELYNNLGVIHRSEIEKFIPDLTPDYRTNLRRKRVKLGPILVFMPDLVKPAAIHLRALLWGLWNGKDLPIEQPADGRVSVTVDPKEVDRHFYRSIGYPVFGPKAIRIDMLDRVITDIYDSSKDWKFQAQHKYAEWLGCNIEDLYEVLQSLGFRMQKTDEAAAPAADVEEVKPEEETAEQPVETEAGEKPQAEVKPELAWFMLKKGKISDRPKPKRVEKPKADFKQKPKKKPVKSEPKAHSYTAKPKKTDDSDDGNPFAILKQLQK